MAHTGQAVEVINTHEQLVRSGGGVAITLHYSGARREYVYGWSVYRVNADGKQVVTDPNAHWSDYGKKVFRGEGSSFHGRQRNALESAKRWVAEQGWYEGEWKRNRMRDYVPKEADQRFPIKK